MRLNGLDKDGIPLVDGQLVFRDMKDLYHQWEIFYKNVPEILNLLSKSKESYINKQRLDKLKRILCNLD